MAMKIVQVLFLCNGEVALGFRQNVEAENNLWGFPSGRVEVGESFEAAAKREALEEVGVQVQSLNQLALINDSKGNEHKFFVCNGWRGELKNAEPELCKEIRWFSYENMPSNCTKITYAAMAELNNSHKDRHFQFSQGQTL